MRPIDADAMINDRENFIVIGAGDNICIDISDIAKAPTIDADELNKFPIRLDHYDKQHGSEAFVFGIESVLEYAEYLPTVSAVPVSELLSLRDNLYKDNLITMRGLRDLNMLIAKYEGGGDHAPD